MSERDLNAWARQRFGTVRVERNRDGRHVVVDNGTPVRILETPGLGEAARREIAEGLVHVSRARSQREQGEKDYKDAKDARYWRDKHDLVKESVDAAKHAKGNFIGRKRHRPAPERRDSLDGVRGFIVAPHIYQTGG
jgi:hypothetical protein